MASYIIFSFVLLRLGVQADCRCFQALHTTKFKTFIYFVSSSHSTGNIFEVKFSLCSSIDLFRKKSPIINHFKWLQMSTYVRNRCPNQVKKIENCICNIACYRTKFPLYFDRIRYIF